MMQPDCCAVERRRGTAMVARDAAALRFPPLYRGGETRGAPDAAKRFSDNDNPKESGDG